MLQLVLSLLLAACLSGLFLKTVREDNVSGKIRNALVGTGLLLVAAALLLLALQTASQHLAPASMKLTGECLPAGYFLKYAQHALISIMAGFILWRSGAWPAGDAKLFILSALAIPVIIPSAAYFPVFLFLSLLVNIFIPAGIVFVLQAANAARVRLLEESGGDVLRAIALSYGKCSKVMAAAGKKPGTLVSFLVLTAIFGAVRFLKDRYSGVFHINETLFFAFMMLAWPAVSSLFKAGGNRALAAAGLCLGLCSFHPFGRLILVNAAYGLTRSLPCVAINKALKSLMKQEAPVTIKPEALSEGVVLTENFLGNIKSAAPEFYSDHFGRTYPDGLTAEQAEQLKRIIPALDVPDRSFSAITARSCKPFAAWIAFGALLTLALRGDMLLILWKNLLHSLNG